MDEQFLPTSEKKNEKKPLKWKGQFLSSAQLFKRFEFTTRFVCEDFNGWKFFFSPFPTLLSKVECQVKKLETGLFESILKTT